MRTVASLWLLCAACSIERTGNGATGLTHAEAGPISADSDAAQAGSPAPETNRPTEPIACTDSVESLYRPANGGELTRPVGSVLRCAEGGSLSGGLVDGLARTAGYSGPELPSGAQAMRLLYRTERGTAPPRAGASGAIVIWPTIPGAGRLPVVVFAPDTLGVASECAPSKAAFGATGTTFGLLAYALVGAGFAVIVPDLAGYAGGGTSGTPRSGFFAAADEGKSVLDAARALREAAPNLFSPHVLLVGHGRGGHAVLSALALHHDYGSGGDLVGVAAFAPVWFPMSSFAALLATPNAFDLLEERNVIAASIWYHYSQGELLDGEGGGPLLFSADKGAAITAFVATACTAKAASGLASTVGELFDPDFAAEIRYAAATGAPCSTDRCQRWVERYGADRPHLLGPATRVPLLVLQGDRDEVLAPERSTCGFDRLEADGANATICIVNGATHDGVVGARADYLLKWIGRQTQGDRAPLRCGLGREGLLNPQGRQASCATFPPND